MSNENSWTCFHCSETFTAQEEAAEHFGSYRSSTPICKVDAEKFREMESEIESWRSECAPCNEMWPACTRKSRRSAFGLKKRDTPEGLLMRRNTRKCLG